MRPAIQSDLHQDACPLSGDRWVGLGASLPESSTHVSATNTSRVLCVHVPTVRRTWQQSLLDQ